MTWQSWAVQTECAECGKERHLTGGLCGDCSEALGYAESTEASE